jgi:hypothetical protein
MWRAIKQFAGFEGPNTWAWTTAWAAAWSMSWGAGHAVDLPTGNDRRDRK